MTHGVLKFSSNLGYVGETGALNESFCDVMAISAVQRHLKQDVDAAEWIVGREILGPALADVEGVRSFTNQPAYAGHIVLGTDPQPKHMMDYVVSDEDNGAVHTNSGIPNHAFYLAAREIGGKVWEKTARIWYEAFTDLDDDADFGEAARATAKVARERFGEKTAEAVANAWDGVGVRSN